MSVLSRPRLLCRQSSAWRVLELVAEAPRRCGSCGEHAQQTCSCHRRKVLQRTAARHRLTYLLAGTVCTASWHIPPPERLCLDQALSTTQVSLITLPDELLGRILRRAWADKPPRPAAEEVRAAASLACVCRRVRAVLRAWPLPLALDFSAARLSAAQRTWLLDPAQALCVEAARFLVEEGSEFFSDIEEGSEEDPWEQPVLENFLALHSGTLLHLSGIPLRLVASVRQGERPALDLSGLRLLTGLGIYCGELGFQAYGGGTPAKHWWLWPECLPCALEELHLQAVHDEWLDALAWAPRPGAGLAERLPRLHTLRVMCVQVYGPFSIGEVIPLLEGFPSLPALEVEGSGADMEVHNTLFARVRSVRITAGYEVTLQGGWWDVATFVDRLCPAGLQAAALFVGESIKLPDPFLIPEGAPGAHVIVHAHEIVRALISRCGDRFAVEVGVPQNPQGWDKTKLCRLVWQRWPAPGAPGMQAARAAHERARAWVADAEQWVLEQVLQYEQEDEGVQYA